MDKDYLIVPLGIYDKEISTEVFDTFKKRCLAGEVKSAIYSPEQRPGDTTEMWLKRIVTTDEDLVCAKILDVELSADGKRMVGKIQPCGPHATLLKSLLKEENVTFGMRSLHDSRDREKKKPMHVLTYDLLQGP